MTLPHFGPRLRPRAPRVVFLLAALLLIARAPIAGLTRDTLPAALSDREFWSLTERFSEPNGYFKSNSGSPDNLLSNENTVSTVAAALADRIKPSGVYLGVGRGATVSALRSGVWPAFCANVASLPLDAASTFIRPSSGRSGSFGAMAAETAGCAK